MTKPVETLTRAQLVDLNVEPPTAAYWDGLQAEHEAYLRQAHKRCANWDRFTTFALFFAMAVVLWCAYEGFIQQFDNSMARYLLIPALLMFLLSVVALDPWPVKHRLSELLVGEFEPIEGSRRKEALELALLDEGCARYVRAVGLQGRELRDIELNALASRVSQAEAIVRKAEREAEEQATLEALTALTPEAIQVAADRTRAVNFYRENPSAALYDFNRRFEQTPPQTA